jgi:ABC-type transporter Mla MlaB component
MLRISQIGVVNGKVIFKLEGSIAGPWVVEVRKVCEQFLSENRELHLDMAGVSFVDTNGTAAISSLKSRGVALENCSPFVEEQLKGPTS